MIRLHVHKYIVDYLFNRCKIKIQTNKSLYRYSFDLLQNFLRLKNVYIAPKQFSFPGLNKCHGSAETTGNNVPCL